MAGPTGAMPGPSPRALGITLIGWLGLAACLTMVFLAMRSVMDVGGSCADGGPYVSAQGCPDGATPSLLLGIFAGFGFGFLASVGGIAVGGMWAATPLLAWSALFGTLGWNFLDYGVFSPPGGSVDLGWAVCGVLFWAMAFGPLLALLPFAGGSVAARARRGDAGRGTGDTVVRVLSGPGQPPRRQTAADGSASTTTTRGGTTITVSSTVLGADDLSADLRAQLEQLQRKLGETTDRRATDPERAALASIAADFGAAITAAAAEAPVDPHARRRLSGHGSGHGAADAGATRADATPAGSPAPADAGAGSEPDAEFTEGTQALLDRLERLADMRDRGLLGPDEYDTAKAAIMAELEGRS